MRGSLKGLGLLVAVLVTNSSGSAQPAASAGASPPPAPTAAAGKEDAKAAAKADAGKSGEATPTDEKEKKPSIVPGYSWTDKPAKPGKWKPRKKVDPNAPLATYPGFRMLGDGSSQVWVHVSRKVNVTAATTGGLPTFVLVGAHVSVHNNTNALVTEFFDTPLARARLKPDAAGAQLVLEMREQAAAKHRVVDGPGGTMTLFIDLPKSQKSYALRDDIEFGARPRTGRVLMPAPAGKTNAKSSPKRGPSP
ncbi:MAG: hypothetical protein U0263_35905 [Polyangiaceae bacterium]